MGDFTRDLMDTVVAVTGASSGIGLASARMLVEGGARVAVQARRSERLDQLVDELGSDKVVGVPGDVTDPAAARELVAAAVRTFGRLDCPSGPSRCRRSSVRCAQVPHAQASRRVRPGASAERVRARRPADLVGRATAIVERP